MLRIRSIPFATCLVLLSCAVASAQWATPTVDGTIQSGEYGNTANGTNQIATNTAQTWCMTWDATNLYVGITNADVSEAAIVYIGTSSPGTTAGQNYDRTSFSSLPFPAQFVTYFKDGYQEYRTASAGAWSNPTAGAETYASSGGGSGTREIAIPWSAITGGAGIPAQFNFFGYLTSSGGYVYGQVPNDNPGAFIGTSATYTQYFSVLNTGNGTSTPPFSNERPEPFSSTDTAGFYHNTFDPFYRSSEGAVPEGTAVTLRFRTLDASGMSGVKVRAYLLDTGSGSTSDPVDTDMTFDQNITVSGTKYDIWKATVTMPSKPTVYYYKFYVYRGPTSGWYSDDYIDNYDNLNKDGSGVSSNGEPFDSFQVTVYDPNFTTPSWMSTANIYQIFPDRFRNGDPTNDYCAQGSSAGCPSFYGAPASANIAVSPWNTLLCDPYDAAGSCYNNFGSIFYGGDLLGIQNELDYIQGLGFDTLYLNPIFEASSNHRYDTDDYRNVDPALGGNAAFNSLAAELNRRGMRVILDGVWNHTSSDSLYFNRYNRFADVGACQSLASPFRSWFEFKDNNVPCTTGDYNGWAGFDSLPALDHANTDVQNLLYATPGSVMAQWYGAGASGWRFDAADDPNFSHAWWAAVRTAGKSYNPNGPLLGEIWQNASPYLAGDQMDGVMNYRFRRNVTGFARGQYNWCDNNDNGNDCIIALTPSQFDAAMRAIRDDYPPQASASMMNLLDSHDTNRALYVLTELGDNGLAQAKQRLELAAIFQFTYIGAPMVMYGDEVAINAPSRYSGSSGPVGDPYTRAPYPWTDQPGDPSVYGPPDTGVESVYTKLGHLRKQYPVLENGAFVTLLTGDTQQAGAAPNTYAYARTGNAQTAVVALNNGGSTNTATVPVGAYFPDGTTLQDVLSGNTYSVSGGNVQLALPAISGVVLLPAPASVDETAPTGSIGTTPAANSNNWLNTSPVSANISASDTGGSGLAQVRYWIDNGPVVVSASAAISAGVSGEGKHTVSARALDNAGNVSALITAPVNIDLTPPVVTLTGAASGGVYAYNAAPAPQCTTSDALSGVATAASLQIGGDNGEGYGTLTATCAGAADLAGNQAQPVSVTYTVQPPLPLSGAQVLNGRSQPSAHPGGLNSLTRSYTLVNSSINTLTGPFQVVISSLGVSEHVVNPTGIWGGMPYVSVPIASLPAGGRASFQITYSGGDFQQPQFTVYAGALRK